MLIRSFLAAAVAVAPLYACAPAADTASEDSLQAGGSVLMASATMVGETLGMSTPESVRYDSEQDVWFISNIVGNPSQKDGQAFISRVAGDRSGEATRFIESGMNGVTLNAPKGMAIVGDTLWVADIDVIRGFNTRTGAPVAEVGFASHNASFLNDVAVGPDGGVYVTDTGIRFEATGEMTQTGSDRVLAVHGRTITELVAGASLANPNGLTWDASGSRWIIVPFGGPDVMEFRAGSTSATSIAVGPGGYDGVEAFADGRLLVSSWTDSSVYLVSAGQMSRLVTGVDAPADFGYDSRRNVIAIPLFNGNRVVYYQVQ